MEAAHQEAPDDDPFQSEHFDIGDAEDFMESQHQDLWEHFDDEEDDRVYRQEQEKRTASSAPLRIDTVPPEIVGD